MNSFSNAQTELQKAIEYFSTCSIDSLGLHPKTTIHLKTLLSATKRVQELEQRNKLLEEVVKATKEALEPFKRMADKFDCIEYREQWPDSTMLQNNEVFLSHCYLTLGDMRKAKEALHNLEANKKGK